jgi:hypothetical protein
LDRIRVVRIGNVNAKIFEPSWKELRQACLEAFGHPVYSDVLQVNSVFLGKSRAATSSGLEVVTWQNSNTIQIRRHSRNAIQNGENDPPMQ